MSLLREIQEWSEEALPIWLRDAARRLFLDQELVGKDYDELYFLLKSTRGILIPEDLIAIPLTAEHIPADADDEHPVILKSIQNLKYVNKIATDQTLNFSEKGMSIIYGGNGAGKSGYARVLKHACRARVKGGEVLPDASLPHAAGKPTAEFVISIDGISHSLSWKAGEVSPSELSTISVFDSNCATAYLVEGDAAYLPRGLDIVESLASKVIPELSSKLTFEINSVDINKDILIALQGDTEVGVFLKNVTHELDLKKLKELGELSENDKGRILEIADVLSEGDPLAKAQQLINSVAHLKVLSAQMSKQFSFVDFNVIENLKQLTKKSSEADLAVKQAADALGGEEELLPGTGEPVWKALYLAAKKYSTEQAYIGHTFPNLDVDAKCVLCQQPIETVSDRMQRFKAHLDDDLSKTASEKSEELRKAIELLEHAALDIGFNQALEAEIVGFDPGLSDEITKYGEKLLEIKELILDSAKNNAWDKEFEIIGKPHVKIRNIAAKKLWSARIYKRAADPSKLDSLNKELKNLKAKEQLNPLVASIESLVSRLELKSQLEDCKKELNPRVLSAKSKEIAGKIITKSLKDALDNEFLLLGVEHIKTKLKDRIEHAKVKYTLLLDLPISNKLDLILSEGEQRAVSLAAFLAELQLTNHRAGIIFDDPVSSLDHVRRRKVALRLVEEAKLRQVIVLTHDIAFLSELLDSIGTAKIDHIVHHLEWLGECSGNIKSGLPWDKVGYRERVAQLKKDANKLLPWPPYPNEKQVKDAREVYSQIRATIEKMVEDVVFNGVITRFSEVVGVGGLSKIAGLQFEHCEAITVLWKKCHRITGSHDQPVLKDAPVPSPTDMLVDIQLIIDLAALVIDSRKK